MTHIINSSDDCDHIESEGCQCGPQVVTVEGEEMCIHRNYVGLEDREIPDFMREG